MPIAIALLERGFISVQEVDLQMARLAGSGQPSAITFVCRLIQACLLSDPPLCSFSAFLLSIETLERISSEPNVKET